MLDCCFINPPHPDLVHPHAQAPLGILYLGAVCEAEGLSVRVANLAGAPMDPAAWRIPAARCYALSGTFLDVQAVAQIAWHLRKWDPDARLLVGGPISLSAARDALGALCLRSGTMLHPLPPGCAVVHGEAETRIADLVRDGAPSDYCACEPPADLDLLPLPARHLWPGPLGGDVFIGNRNYFGGGSATMITTRGCPMSCAFCAGPALASRHVRFRSADSIVAEMEQCVSDFGIRQFRFSDEFFTCRREHVLSVCDAILRSRILEHGDGLAWRVSVGVKPNTDREMFEILRASGCREVSLGVESADDAVLERINKKQTTADSLVALRNARDAGMKSRALMMVGAPGESPATLLANLRFIRTAPADQIAITVFTPIPGCDIASNPERYGCRILETTRSVCVYGPDGRNAIRPTIAVDGFDPDAHAADMAAAIAAAERANRIGRG